MINKEGKLFGKISIIDILAIVFIIFLAFGVYARFFMGNQKVETASSPIEYVIKVSEVRIGTANALSSFKGDVYNDTTKEYIGTITDVTYEEAKGTVELLNGELKEVTLPERYDVLVTVRLDGKINSTGYYTKTNQPIAAGSDLVFTSKAAKTTGIILDVYEAE